MTIGIRDHDLPVNTHNTYDVFFFDDTILTTLTHDPDTVSDWISEIMYIHRRRLHSLIVGLNGLIPTLDKLDSDYGIGGEARVVELRKRAADEYGRKELKNAGLKGLSSFVMGREMEKPRRVRTSRWENRWLTADQEGHIYSEGREMTGENATISGDIGKRRRRRIQGVGGETRGDTYGR
ncbi:hypothetical protein Salat_2926200 [Sesamum alatum]|uniref:Uncharacterized protein n=1 Tax=Sesamum alatum TaxID=300844 RepID=A0AAE2C8N3_9LAMI|nr:hypothetical protein Salat_2926200 [Sesamum alatum]